MAYGLQVFSDYGSMQIDDINPCYGLMTKGTLTTDNVTLTSGISPIIAYRCIACSGSHVRTTRSGDSYTFYFHVAKDWGGGFINYYIFDKAPPTPSSSGMGLEIYNSAGNVVFNSMYPPMRIVNVAPINHSGGSINTTVPAGRVYAIAAQGAFYQETVEVVLDSFGNPTGAVLINTAVGGYQDYGTSVEQTALFGTSSHFGTTDISGSPAGGMVIDVTNL